MTSEVQGQFGGRVAITFGTLSLVIAEAEVKLSPSTTEVSAKANQDGSAAYEVKVLLVGGECEFRNVNDTNWSTFNMQYGNVTVTEIDSGRTHLFTNTRFVGTPDVNVSSGAITGLKWAGGTYQFLPTS
jgi:hypothetical protein